MSEIRKRKGELFVNFLQATREFNRRCMSMNLSSETLRIYKKCLNRLLDTCLKEELGDNESNILVEDISTSVLRLHFANLLKELQPITVRIHYMCLHSFFTFLYKEGDIKKNNMENVDKPRVPNIELQAFTHTQVDMLLNVFDKNKFTGYRNYCLTCTLFSTGIRRAEAINIKLEDILWDIKMIKIHGKGNKERKVPISDTLYKVLEKYIQRRKAHINKYSLSSSPYLFINSQNGMKFNINTITAIYNEIGRNKHIKGVKVSPHTFRHTFAKFFLLNGGDVFTLQKILGHADITTTKKYVNMNDKDMRVQDDKYNPLECDYWKY